MFPLVSGINSRLLSVNHALISPILIHPAYEWYFSHLCCGSIDSPLSSSITSSLFHFLPFLQILPTVAFLFFFSTDTD